MKYKYGLLKYSTINLGDEIQSIAARQFLPRVDCYLDRDHLNKVKSSKKIKLIMNGWFTEKPENWPPSPDIEPLFVSFSISRFAVKKMTSPESIEYFRRYEPIGCRDKYTLEVLRRHGIKAYFSGCLTLTLKSNVTERSDEILLVDLDDEAIKVIPQEVLKKAIMLDHYSLPPFAKKIYRGIYRTTYAISTLLKSKYSFLHEIVKKTQIDPLRLLATLLSRTSNTLEKFKAAERILERYARAKLVVTSRLHCALPCLAFGTPVIFVHRNLRDPRFSGYLEYMRAYSLEEFKESVSEIDWENPKPNPKSIQKLRENLIKTCKDFINRD